MKSKFKNILLVAAFFLYFGVSSVLASSMSLVLNDKPLILDMINENGRVLVPIRKICEDMGYDVLWDGDKRRVFIKKDFTSAIFTIGEKDVIVNNEKIGIDVAPRIVGDRTYVPVRAFTEAFNDDVEYIKNENRINIKSNINGNKNEVVFLEKAVEKDLEGRKVKYSERIPQILNYNSEVAVDKINAYYKKEGYNAITNFNEPYEEGDVLTELGGYKYELCHNDGNIISFVCHNYVKSYGAGHMTCKWDKGDVFNIATGEKLMLKDILKGTDEEIEKLKQEMCSEMIEDGVGVELFDFYIDSGRLVIGVYSRFGKISIDISENKELFNERFLEAMFGKDTNEEYRVIESAHKYFNKDVKIIDKTVIKKDECYVFDGRDEMIAIDRSGEKIYIVEKIDDVYRVLESKKANNEIGNLTALKLVMNKMNLKEYSYEIGGILREDEEEYIIVNMCDLEGKEQSSLAVNKKTGEIFAYYFE